MTVVFGGNVEMHKKLCDRESKTKKPMTKLIALTLSTIESLLDMRKTIRVESLK